MTANPGCLMQTASSISRSGGEIALAHTVEVLDASIRGLAPADLGVTAQLTPETDEARTVTPMYQQVLDPVSDSLGLSCIFAALPLVVLFVLLGVAAHDAPGWRR